MLSAIPQMGLIIPLLVGTLGGMNGITSSTISLEGKGIATLRSYPVSPWTVLLSKLATYSLLTAVPAFVCTILLCVIFAVPFWIATLGILAMLALVILFGASGLIINLKLPTFDWTSELVAVKQSVSTLTSMFLNIGISALLLGAYFAFGRSMPVAGFLGVITGALVLVDIGAFVWLKKRGTGIFIKFH